MAYKYDQNDAQHITWMIHKRRPDWTKPGILRALEELAEAGASLGQATTAAENATLNKTAKTPAAIKWPEHLNPVNGTGLKLATHRFCQVCEKPVKHPVETMTQTPEGIWLCQPHKEAA